MRYKKIVIRQAILIVTVLALARCHLQTKMLYYPTPSAPTQETLTARNIQFWPELVEYRGFVATAQTKTYQGTIVVFHGNGGSAADRAFYVKALAPLGFRVILAEYPVYGGRKGKLGELPFVQDAQETIRIAYEKYGEPLFLLGRISGLRSDRLGRT